MFPFWLMLFGLTVAMKQPPPLAVAAPELTEPPVSPEPLPSPPGSTITPLALPSQSPNPPILHRKEEFVAVDYQGREKFARLTRQEESWGLYEEPSAIGTRYVWQATLKRSGALQRGHRLVRA